MKSIRNTSKKDEFINVWTVKIFADSNIPVEQSASLLYDFMHSIPEGLGFKYTVGYIQKKKAK
jgi:hypothetical protein